MAVEGKTILQTPERTELTGKEGIPFQEGERNGHVLLERIREYSQTEVVDDLTSDDSEKALSAAQGKVLNDKIAEISNPASADKDGLMSKEDKKTFDSIRFSENENSIWFNGKKYGAYKLNYKLYKLSGGSLNQSDIINALDGFTQEHWDLVSEGGIGYIVSPSEGFAFTVLCSLRSWVYLGYKYLSIVIYGVEDVMNLLFGYNNSSSTYEGAVVLDRSYIGRDEIVNNLTSTNTGKPLSAAMGKKLNDKIEDIKSEISALRDEIEALKGSGA